MDDLKGMLLEALKLKSLPRTGWLRAGIENPESVAAHSWGVAWLCMVLCPKELNKLKVLEIALIHDLAEVRIGDITPYDGIDVPEKHKMESAAFVEMTEQLCNRQHLRDLWNEQSAEADFVKQMDKLDMALQAQEYGGLEEFIESALQVLINPVHRQLAKP
ncbi:HD domain-containing protein [Deltaproteobacteria bacterium]|nr:HD domain-containing protein [Deltaproteobacteria bacterium]